MPFRPKRKGALTQGGADPGARVFVLSEGVAVRYALNVEMGVGSAPCAVTLRAGITVSTGGFCYAPVCNGAEVSRVFVLSAEVDVRYALMVEVSTNSDPCVPALCGGIAVNTCLKSPPLPYK